MLYKIIKKLVVGLYCYGLISFETVKNIFTRFNLRDK